MQETEQGGQPQEVAERKDEPLHAGHYSVLTVGTELAVLSPGSSVQQRIFSYAKHFKEMHIILLSGPVGVSTTTDANITVYPTNSSNKVARYFDALKIGKTVRSVDIVSTQDPFETALVAWRIAKKHKAALHVQVHTDFLAPEYAAHSFINWIRVRIARFILGRAVGIRVVSNRVRDSVLNLGIDASKVSVLPIYINLDRFRNTTVPMELSQKFAAFQTKVLVVSRLEPEKDVSLAIRAFKENAPADACLIILGQGSEYTMLERLVTKLGLDARVFFEGHQDPAPYYKLADVLLVPSVYEGYGQVIVEALAAGKPVISTDVGVAQEAGAITAPRSEFGLAFHDWLQSGQRSGELKNYPYASMEQYVQMYCADIAAAKKEKAVA